ncbi:MAG: hypothetical protein ACTSWQ_02420 [Candidatus Thorarchaeota archaeon]
MRKRFMKFLAMFRRPKKKFTKSMYVDCYIVLSGRHEVEIRGLEGISLKKVRRDIYNQHKGLKYWISSDIFNMTTNQTALSKMSEVARVDIFDLVFGETPRPFDGIEA